MPLLVDVVTEEEGAATMVWVWTLMLLFPARTRHPALLFTPKQTLAGPIASSNTVVTWAVAPLHV
ncbi:MAG: hypothetical protein IPL89_14385 [Acidobacteria bacterium]|nr:hypothetical protein [Acidobacteriota bacterium]